MKRSFKEYFRRDRKVLYMSLGIVIMSILTLTIVYATLSTTLSINGNTEVLASNWDIHLDNVELNNKSATTNKPTITSSTTATFSTTLSKPGDFYEFTIDVVNDGSIDAMIDSISKTPELTTEQKKYLNYIVEYQNGEAITTKQLVKADSFVRLKVKVEFRKDILASDLPKQEETLNLSFMVNYVQSDETGTIVKDDGIYDMYKIGNEICYGQECFYVISSNEETVALLAKYNLHVGYTVNSSGHTSPLSNPTGIQDVNAKGSEWDDEWNGIEFPWIGTIEFSDTEYWVDSITSYPAYVYNSNSKIYPYVENYRLYLESQGVSVEEARLIKKEELKNLECSKLNLSCEEYPDWVGSTSYWSGTVSVVGFETVFNVSKWGVTPYTNAQYYGIRPVIVIKK